MTSASVNSRMSLNAARSRLPEHPPPSVLCSLEHASEQVATAHAGQRYLAGGASSQTSHAPIRPGLGGVGGSSPASAGAEPSSAPMVLNCAPRVCRARRGRINNNEATQVRVRRSLLHAQGRRQGNARTVGSHRVHLASATPSPSASRPRHLSDTRVRPRSARAPSSRDGRLPTTHGSASRGEARERGRGRSRRRATRAGAPLRRDIHPSAPPRGSPEGGGLNLGPHARTVRRARGRWASERARRQPGGKGARSVARGRQGQGRRRVGVRCIQSPRQVTFAAAYPNVPPDVHVLSKCHHVLVDDDREVAGLFFHPENLPPASVERAADPATGDEVVKSVTYTLEGILDATRRFFSVPCRLPGPPDDDRVNNRRRHLLAEWRKTSDANRERERVIASYERGTGAAVMQFKSLFDPTRVDEWQHPAVLRRGDRRRLTPERAGALRRPRRGSSRSRC